MSSAKPYFDTDEGGAEMGLDDRKKVVLQAIVDDYVATCEPVGSKSLIDRHDFTVSSATLRNDMAELEQLGYL